MAKLFSNPTYKNQVGYNGFDMSHSLKFSTTTGELIPVLYDYLQPGDKITIKSELKTRTMPMRSAAFVNCTEHIEYFFVPFRQMYQFFGQFFFGIDDLRTDFPVSSIQGITDSSHQPNANYLPQLTSDVFRELFAAAESPNDFPFSDSYFGVPAAHLRLFEPLGLPLIPMKDKYESGLNTTANRNISPFLFAAYQKIFMDYYRSTDHEQRNVKAYNFDSCYNSPTLSYYFLNGARGELFKLRYRSWKPDFFTFNYNSPLISTVGSLSSEDANDYGRYFHQWLSGASYTANSTDTDVQIGLANNSPLSPSVIRTSFALQKMLEVTRRAAKSVDAQTLAHFGVDMPKALSGNVLFLGGSHSRLVISDVTSTAGTSEASLGEIGGKAFGYDKSSSIKFEASEHGVLMAIYSLEPSSDYSQLGFDRLLSYVDRQSWPMPEFENLGMQPLYTIQSLFPSGDVGDTVYNSFIGWQYRYSELKAKFNRVIGSMNRGRNMSSWTAQRTFIPYNNTNPVSNYYISPNYLDDIFEFAYSSSYDDVYSRDPFFHELYFDYKKASKMSTYGLQSL